MKTKTINSIQDHNAFQIEKIEALGDPLVNLKKNIDWEGFRPKLTAIHSKERKSNAGATPFDVVFMLQILILQQLNNLADEKTEFMIRDRLTYQRFLSIKCGDRIPDAKTIWVFRNTMMALGLYVSLFDEFNRQLAELGYSAKQGQLIDATFIEAPRQRNTREENAQIKAGETPEAWKAKGKEPMLRQKDVDATWTKKNSENHYGYKNHINADQQHKLIQSYEVSTASVHDSQVFEVLLDQTLDESGNKRPVFADSAYRSVACEAMLEAEEIPSKVHERPYKGKPLTDEQKALNKEKSRVRVRVEHVFGAQALMGMHTIRTIGIERAKIGICLRNLTYNMVRYIQLIAIKKSTQVEVTT